MSGGLGFLHGISKYTNNLVKIFLLRSNRPVHFTVTYTFVIRFHLPFTFRRDIAFSIIQVDPSGFGS